MLGTRYRLDSSWRRPAGGNVVVAGSPLRLFRLSTGGAQVAAMVEVGEAPDTAAVHQMLDRFVEAGALHPQHPTAPFRPAQVTIVVPAFGPLQVSLVEQLARHPGPVVVVDDAGPAPFGNDAPTDRVQLVRHERNRGPAAARNTGLALVTTPLVAFLDTDVTPDGDWLLPLLTHFADERVALVAPRVMGAPGDTRLHEYEQRHSSLDLGDEPARIAAGTRVSYVPAAALVCRVAALRAIDGFDADMRVGEDVDLVWRLAAAGYRCRYEPAGQVRHTPRATISAWCRQRMGYGRSAAPLAQRHPGALAPVRMSGWSALAWVLLVARHPLLALGVAAGTSAALVRKLHDLPPRDAALLAARGHAAAGGQLADAVVRVWWPVAAVAAVFVPRLRPAVAAAFVLPAAVTAVRTRSAQPLADLPLSTLDRMSYGVGVWRGVVDERTAAPLLPDFTNWPPRAGG